MSLFPRDKERPPESGGSEPAHFTRCWRCTAENVPMARDPMMPKHDRIGVCAQCALQREAWRKAHPRFDMSTAIK